MPADNCCRAFGARRIGRRMASRRHVQETELTCRGYWGAAAPRRLIVTGGLCDGDASIFAAGSFATRAKIPSLQILRPEFFACLFISPIFSLDRRKTQAKSVKGVAMAGEAGPPPYRLIPIYGTKISSGSSWVSSSASMSTVTCCMPTIFHCPPVLARVIS